MRQHNFLAILIAALFVSFFSGCKTKYISIPEYHTEYISRTDSFIRTDSVYVKDSVFVFQKGDTVYYNKVVFKDRFHDVYKVKIDTLVKNDTVSIPLPVVKELSRSEQRLIGIGKFAIAFVVFAVAAGAFVFWYRNKKC